MELRRKLGILADAAKNDASCASGGAKERDSRESEGIGPVVGTGSCRRGCIRLETIFEVSPDPVALAGRYADRLSRLGMPLRGAAPFLATLDHRPRGPVAPPRQPELPAHA